MNAEMLSNPSQTDGLASPKPPESGEVKWRAAFRKVALVAVTAGSLSMVACTTTEGKEAASTTTGLAADIPVSAEDPARFTDADHLSRRIAHRNKMTDELTKGYDIEKMRGQLKDFEDPNVFAKGLLTKIVDLKDVSKALTNSDPEKAKAELSDVADPELKQKAEQQIYANAIENAFGRIILDPQDAIDEIAKLPEPYRTQAQIPLQKAIGARAVNTSSFDPAKGDKIATFITDPDVKNQVMQAIELNKQNYDYLYGNRGGARYDSNQYNQKRNEADRVKNALDADAKSFKEGLGSEELLGTKLSSDILTMDDEIAKVNTGEIKKHNNFDAAPYGDTVLPELQNRDQTINLKEATSPKKVETKLHGETETYEEFAQARIVDGKLVLEFEKDAQIDETAKQQILAVFEHARPLLEAAYEAGDLSVTRFVLGSSYDPFYLTYQHETFMVLPRSNQVTIDQLASGLVHETIHSLTRSATTGEQIEVHEATKIAEACDAVKNASFEHLERSLRYLYPELLQGVLEAAKPEHKPVIQFMIDAVNNRTFEQLVTGYVPTNSEYAYILNNCEDFNFFSVFNEVARQQKIVLENDSLNYLSQDPKFGELIKEWNFTMGYASIYEKINESSFVETNESSKEYLGHSQDNVSELMASLADAALTYTDQLSKALADMESNDQIATIQALQMTFTIITNRHPDLAGLMSSVEADILAKTYGTK